MLVAMISVISAVFLGFGAVDEFVNRGLRNGEVQPAIISAAGFLVSVLALVAGVAYAMRKPYASRLCLFAGLLLLVVHGYAALPPHRNVGIPALLVAVVSGLGLIAAATRRHGPSTIRQ